MSFDFLDASIEYKTVKNTDISYVKDLKKRLKSNNGYCPCKPVKTPDTKCPCKEFRENGSCDCGMYIRVPDYDE